MAQEVEHHILCRFNLTKKIGSGAYGHVWKVSQRKTASTLALKKIFDAFQHSVDAQRTYREICYLHELNHPNIIKLHNVIRAENDKDLYLLFQFMEADLHNAIGQKILKDIHNRFIMYQIMKAMKYLHSADIIHRDLKPSNVLINSDCNLKICDFGLARSLSNDTDAQDVVMTEQVATRWYRAPEVLLGSQSYEKSADVWSIGCILGQLLLGKPLFPGSSTLNQLERVLTFTGKPKKQDIESLNSDTANTMIESLNFIKAKPIREWFKAQIPKDALDILSQMLHFNPQKRPSVTELLKHSYFSQFSNAKEEIESKKAIHPPISDNKKLSLKQYKQLIYQRIKKLYLNGQQTPMQVNLFSEIPPQKSHQIAQQPQQNAPQLQNQQHSNHHFHPTQPYSSAESNKRISTSMHRATEVMREKTNEFRNTFYQKSSSKLVNHSASKYTTPQTPTHTSAVNYSILRSSQNLEEEKEKLKRKQSLKDILKNKREKSSHMKFDRERNNQNQKESLVNSPILSKYYKNSMGNLHSQNIKETSKPIFYSKH